MVGIRFGGSRDEILTLLQRLGVITPPYSGANPRDDRQLKQDWSQLPAFFPLGNATVINRYIGTLNLS